jgi:hypothetical protein
MANESLVAPDELLAELDDVVCDVAAGDCDADVFPPGEDV